MKKVMLYLFGILLLLIIAIVLFINLSPVFGGNLTKEQKEIYSQFDNFVDGKFVSEYSAEDMDSSDYLSMAANSERRPVDNIPISEIDWNLINSEEDSLTWFGHSAFLLSIDNKKILVDPMLGPNSSPVPFIGIKRYSEDLLHLIDDMPTIDAVFITHDHYDHLDYQSIVKLKNKTDHFFVPLGVSAHLIRWGVPEEKITELNWWDETEFGGLNVAFTPSIHFSGRGLFNRNTTLWGGWVLIGKNTRLYVSGDGGYGGHFEEIGKKYGPFDLTLIEGAQYDERWADKHMIPEQSVQAHIDVEGENMMLTHWGSFTLARHGWTEPVERALEEAKKKEVSIITPKIGETVILDSELTHSNDAWWKK